MQSGAHAQWKTSGGSAATLQTGLIVLDADGDWALDTAAVAADGYVIEDAEGDPAVDDAASSGLMVFKAPRDIYAL